MNILEINSLKKKYDNFQLDLDLNIRQGEFVALIGPNGTGKSTTICCLLNMVEKDSGEINIFDLDHIKYEAKIKEKMAIILEQQYFYGNIRIESIFKFYSGFYPKWNWNKVNELREKFELNYNKKFKELSKGMKVKLSFIIALSTGASFYLFDEPTSGLDPSVRHLLLSEIKKLKKDKNISFLFTSHIMSDIEYFADRIVFLNKGKIVFDESKEDLNNNWKKIQFRTEKKLDFKELKKNLFILNQNKNNYHLILKNDSEQVAESLKTQTGLDIEIEDISLNELFVGIVENANFIV